MQLLQGVRNMEKMLIMSTALYSSSRVISEDTVLSF